MQETKKRNSSIEILRIISMFMIIFHHLACHGGLNYDGTEMNINRLCYILFYIGGKIGVDIFVLISGYFLSNSKKDIDLIHIAKFIGELLFYSIVINIIFVVTGRKEIGLWLVKNALTPITSTTWWFATSYFLLYLLHPYINALINSINRKKHMLLIIVTLSIWCVLPTILNIRIESNNLIWFTILYSISAYISKYEICNLLKRKTAIIASILSFSCMYLLILVFLYLDRYSGFFGRHISNLYSQDSIFSLLISTSLLITFLQINMKENKVVNFVAASTFGIYLIHDNPYIRPALWKEIVKIKSFETSTYFIPYSIFVVVLIFVVCLFIDIFRRYVFEMPLMNLLKKFVNKETRN